MRRDGDRAAHLLDQALADRQAKAGATEPASDRRIGLKELAADSPDEYVKTAVTLAGDLEHLERIRSGVRARFEQSPLRDEKRFAAGFEAQLRTAWRQSNEVQAP